MRLFHEKYGEVEVWNHDSFFEKYWNPPAGIESERFVSVKTTYLGVFLNLPMDEIIIANSYSEAFNA